MNKELNNAEKEPTPMSLVYVKNRSSKVWSIGHYLGQKGKWYYIAEMDEVGFDEMSVSNPYEDAAENAFDVFMKKHGGNIKIEIKLYSAMILEDMGYRKRLVAKGLMNNDLSFEKIYNYHELAAKGYTPDAIISEVTEGIIKKLLTYEDGK
jgi:hypothetical protein